MLTLTPIDTLLQQQRDFFATGKTKEFSFRKQQLENLKAAIKQEKEVVFAGLKADLNKSEFESIFELAVVQDIDYAIKNLKSWMKPRTVKTPLTQFPASSKIYPEPLGVVLIISPWNYPFSLAIAPLIGAIASGNCAIIKPSELSAHTSQALAKIINNTFDSNYITVVEGGVETSQQLLAQKFDHIFFTGGTAIGKIVMQAAAKHLTPVTLELGGKSPCIVDSDINLKETAKRITWGKLINAGQTCIAPDYLLVNRQIKQQLITEISQCIQQFYGDNPETSPDYPRIISDHHFERLSQFLTDGEIVIGGTVNQRDRYIAPTILTNVKADAPIMQDEIFGPILPILEYDNLTEAINFINSRPKPLALYFFSQDTNKQQQILQNTSSGGVCINDTVMQVGVTELPFGGVGDSGIGCYHGKASFDTFTHYKSVLTKSFRFDLNWRYAPYQDKIEQVKKLFS